MIKNKLKKVIAFTLVINMLLVPNISVSAKSLDLDKGQREQLLSNPEFSNANDSLLLAYKDIVIYANQNNLSFDISLEDFVSGYNSDDGVSVYYGNVKENLENGYYNTIQNSIMDNVMSEDMTSSVASTSSSGGDLSSISWQYDIGTTLPRQANYSTHSMLTYINSGDIVYEAAGGFGITGHAAIVEGIFYSAQFNQWYVRIVEAIEQGVKRSLLDDDRYDIKNDIIYRVNGASYYQKSYAVSFSLSQLGKPYMLDFAHNYSINESNWYCSELVWAAYYNYGIDLETTWQPFNEPGVTPRDITTSSFVVSYVNIY